MKKLLAALLLFSASAQAALQVTSTSTGNVTGPASAHDGGLVLFNGTTGKIIKESTVTQHNALISGANGTVSSVAPGSAGNQLVSDGTDWTSAAVTEPFSIKNTTVAPSISSSTLVLALKQSDGSTNCSATAPCIVGFRSATATDGSYQTVSFTAASSLTLAAVDSIGVNSGAGQTVYIYAIQDTTSELCTSTSVFDDYALQSATALTGSADTTAGTLYCTNAHTSRPIRFLSKVNLTWSNPNWSAISTTGYIPHVPRAPTVTKFITGNNTYTPPVGVLWLEVLVVGAGAGGGGNTNNGNNGGDTTFGGVVAKGGLGGQNNGVAGLGGGANTVTGAIYTALDNTPGGTGYAVTATAAGSGGGGGGVSCLGGGATGGTNGIQSPQNIAANSGSGGGGAQKAASSGEGGGGAGGCVRVIVSPPLPTNFTANIGTGGGGGSGTVSGATGGDGLIVIKEFYQ